MNYLKFGIAIGFIPFFASAQGIYDPISGGWRPARPSDFPNQQAAPFAQPYYPRPTTPVITRPAQTSIAAPVNQAPAALSARPAAGGMPILYTDGTCPGCISLRKDYGYLFPMYVIESLPDRSMSIPALSTGENLRSFFEAKAREYAKLQQMPLPTAPQPLTLTLEANGRYYLNGAFDKGPLPPDYVIPDPVTGKPLSLPEIYKKYKEGRLTFTGTYDPETRELASTKYVLGDPAATAPKATDPKLVPPATVPGFFRPSKKQPAPPVTEDSSDDVLKAAIAREMQAIEAERKAIDDLKKSRAKGGTFPKGK